MFYDVMIPQLHMNTELEHIHSGLLNMQSILIVNDLVTNCNMKPEQVKLYTNGFMAQGDEG
jgi:hypothetical protein